MEPSNIQNPLPKNPKFSKKDTTQLKFHIFTTTQVRQTAAESKENTKRRRTEKPKKEILTEKEDEVIEEQEIER